MHASFIALQYKLVIDNTGGDAIAAYWPAIAALFILCGAVDITTSAELRYHYYARRYIINTRQRRHRHLESPRQ